MTSHTSQVQLAFLKRFPTSRDFVIGYYDGGPFILLEDAVLAMTLPGTEMTLGTLWRQWRPWSHSQLTAIWELCAGYQGAV